MDGKGGDESPLSVEGRGRKGWLGGGGTNQYVPMHINGAPAGVGGICMLLHCLESALAGKRRGVWWGVGGEGELPLHFGEVCKIPGELRGEGALLPYSHAPYLKMNV